MTTDSSLTYIAAPYSHPDAAIKAQRLVDFARFDAEMMNQGIFTVSPMTKAFELQHATFPDNWEYWRDYSYALMDRCSNVIVLLLDGWDKSVGVQAEIEYANELEIPIKYMRPISD